MDDLMGDLFTGGNHLANVLVARGCMPDKQSSYDQVMRDYGDLCAEQFLPPGYAPPLVTLDGYLPAPGELAEPPYAPDATYAALEPPE
jgi:hypothetical protein